MSLTGLTSAVLSEPVLAQAMADARGGVLPTLDLTGPAGVRPFVVAGLSEQGRTVLAVSPTTREAEGLEAALADLLPPESVALFPSWETLPHERLSPRSDTVGRRLAVLRRLRHPDAAGPHGPLRVVVAPVRSVLQPQVPGLGSFFQGRTWEKGGFTAALRAIEDDRGRAMVLINWNTDMGDGMEWSNAVEYPGYAQHTADAYRMMINEIIYSLTH